MNKKKFTIMISIIGMLVIALPIFYTAKGWIYVKYNGELYVAVNMLMDEEYASDVVGEKIGLINSKSISFLKPVLNNTSNGFTKGTEIYESTNINNIVLSYNGKFIEVVNVKNEGWGNGFKIKLKDGEITY